MLTIHKNQGRYFVVDNRNHFEELQFPADEKDWRQGWERLHEGEGEFIRISPYYAFPQVPQQVFSNWNDFPELHEKPVFVCHRQNEWGDNFSDIRKEMGL